MIVPMKGSLFDLAPDGELVFVNPINCVGVMGAGLAKEFADKLPEMEHDYVIRCSKNAVQLGLPYLWENGDRRVLNFPTKGHWKDLSKLVDIDNGLAWIKNNYRKENIRFLVMPALGCGLGGLDWVLVSRSIGTHLGNIQDLCVYLYGPKEIGPEPYTDAMIEDLGRLLREGRPVPLAHAAGGLIARVKEDAKHQEALAALVHKIRAITFNLTTPDLKATTWNEAYFALAGRITGITDAMLRALSSAYVAHRK